MRSTVVLVMIVIKPHSVCGNNCPGVCTLEPALTDQLINLSYQEALQAPQELGVASLFHLQSSDPMRQSEVLAHDLTAASGLTPSRIK